MAITVRRSAWDPFGSLVRQLDQDFDGLIRRSFGTSTSFVPAVDVVKDGSDIVVTVEVPGVDIEKDLNVEVNDGRLVISGKRDESSSSEERGVLIRETRSGEFRREFALPEHVTADSIEADYDRGVLTVRVHDVTKPKAEPRRIEVRSGKQAVQVEGSTEEK